MTVIYDISSHTNFFNINFKFVLFSNKGIKKNIIWLILIVTLCSLILSIVFSMSDRGSFDDFFLNLIQFVLLSLFYASLLLGLHYFITKTIRKFILVENYTNYVMIFSFFSFFVTILYYFLLAFVFKL